MGLPGLNVASRYELAAGVAISLIVRLTLLPPPTANSPLMFKGSAVLVELRSKLSVEL